LKKINTLQSNSALICRENENYFPQIKGKELLLPQGLIPPATPFSVKETEDLAHQSLRPLRNWRKQAQDDFSLLRSTPLPQFSCVFWDSLTILPFPGPACRDTQRHKSLPQKRVLPATFTGITAAGLLITFASACVLWRDYWNMCSTSQNLVFCTPEMFSRPRTT